MLKRKPFLKWAGGKFCALDHIRAACPEEIQLWVEPFVGAGAVFLNLPFEEAWLSDINSDLIGLYQILQKQPERWVQEASRLFTPEANEASCYYGRRREFNEESNSWNRALLFLYLNRHGYNGLCRYNRAGAYNVPFGRYPKPYFPERELFHFSAKSQKVTFYCESFEHALSRASTRLEAVVYCDPPYTCAQPNPDEKQKGGFRSYHKTRFGEQEQTRLAGWCETLAQRALRAILISNHDTVQARAWYDQARYIKTFSVPRRISVKAKERVPAQELLAVY